MAVTLSVVNDYAGGAVATIAGGNAGDTNNLYRAAFTGTANSTMSMSLVGSRVGNGTISASTSGLWLWFLDNITAGLAHTYVHVYAPITSTASTSVLSRIMTQVQTQIVALSLTGITSNVYIKWLPRQLDTTTDVVPAVIISPAPMPESTKQDLTATDKIGYPVLITILDKQNQDYDDNIARDTLWRETIRKEFQYQPLPINEVLTCDLEMKPQINTAAFEKNMYMSQMVLRFLSREQRGN